MALSYSDTKLIAGRYGAALCALAAETKQQEAVEAAIPVLQALSSDEQSWKRFADNPLITADTKLEILKAALKSVSLPGLWMKTLEKIIRNGRLGALSAIVSEVQNRLRAARQEQAAEVVSALPLSAASQQALKEALQKQSGNAVAVSFRVDPALIGGMTIRSGAKMLDYSLRGRLGAAKETLNQSLMNLPS